MNKTTAAGSSSGAFVDKNADAGIAGTKITATDMNAHQDEIINAIIGAGITPSAAALTQLRDAIRNTAVPIGYLYTQLPGMSAPSDLWSWATWENVSETFAGSFFRSEGGNASAFGAGQQGDAFQGHWHQYIPGTTDTTRNGKSDGGTGISTYTATDVVKNPVTDGQNGTPRTAAETRPVNYTVRIWRRTA